MNRFLGYPLVDAWYSWIIGYLLVAILDTVILVGVVLLRVMVWELPPVPKENKDVIFLGSTITAFILLPMIAGITFGVYRYRRSHKKIQLS